MNLSIEDVIKKSGDSYLESCSYYEGKALLRLELDELDRIVLMTIRTQFMALNIPDDKGLSGRTCFLELEDLREVLGVKNGIYVASDDFGSFMSETRKNLNLAYGLRDNKYNFVLSLTGSDKLASFVVESLEDITMEFEDI